MALTTNAISLDAPTAGSALAERTNHTLLKIIKANFNTKYAAQAPILSAFRDAVSAHGGTDADVTLIADFRTHVPLSSYDCYKPFVDKFNMQPCKKEEVDNLFAPGLPEFLAATSATTRLTSKILPKYDHSAGQAPVRFQFVDPDSKYPLAALQYCGCMDIKEVGNAMGQVVQRIPLCIVSSGGFRRVLGWKIDDDESRMSLTMPYYAVPWAATIIDHYPSFLTIHGLFFLTHRNVDRFFVTFATAFVDLFRQIDKHWDMLMSCIRDGILPDLEGINHVRVHLQAQFHADPERAAELLEIGPPSSLEGWAARVWQNASSLSTVCSGPFGTVLPKIRSILGSNIPIHSARYASTEAQIGVQHDANKPEEFFLLSEDVIEFLDVSLDENRENIRQAWELQAGKQYEPILTTRDGLWRYQLGDLISIIGFNPESKSPIFKWTGRKSSAIQLPHTQITEVHLLEAIKHISSENIIQVQEFTTTLDDRTLPPTVGFFVELTGSAGPNAHFARQKLLEILVATDTEHQRARELGQFPLPTIRIVEAGTFAEFRHWKGRSVKTGSGQTKVPVVLVDPAAQKWILEKVTQEI